MAESARITDPLQLLKEPNSRQQATLVLLQPLANADMLKACRRPESSVYRTAREEFLNIQPLGKAWRQELVKVPPIRQLTFDLTLPKEDEANKGSFEKVYWDTAVPREGGLGIGAPDVMRLVITIATVTRMRIEGDLQFAVIWDETDRMSRLGMTLLKTQLLKVAEYRDPAVKDGDQGSKTG